MTLVFKIQEKILAGEVHTFSKGDIISCRKFLNKGNLLHLGKMAHPVDADLTAQGHAMIRRFRLKSGAWNAEIHRRAKPEHLSVMEEAKKFFLVNFLSPHDSRVFLPVFRVEGSDKRHFDYMNVPWQHHYDGTKTGFRIVS